MSRATIQAACREDYAVSSDVQLGAIQVGEARRRYFEDNDFGDDGGYSERWVWLKIGPLRLPLLNTVGRVRAVARHDLHHIATGYGTDLLGESEIGAWEVGAGCGRFTAAWVLNLSAIGAGLWLSPRRIFRAFCRGRRSLTLYLESGDIDAALVAGSVAQLQERLRIAAPPAEATLGDVLSFVGWMGVALVLGLVWLAAFLLPIAGVLAAIAG